MSVYGFFRNISFAGAFRVRLVKAKNSWCAKCKLLWMVDLRGKGRQSAVSNWQCFARVRHGHWPLAVAKLFRRDKMENSKRLFLVLLNPDGRGQIVNFWLFSFVFSQKVVILRAF